MDSSEGSAPGDWKRFHAVIHGDVQGVGFRYHTRNKAQALGIEGYVCNLADGVVEVVAEGSEEKLQRLLAWLQQGPPWSRVTEVEVQWQSPQRSEGEFEVRY